MHYVYLHLSHKTKQPFYVGVAKINPKRDRGYKTKYERAYAYAKRPKHWKNIAQYGYDVLIYKDGLHEQKANDLESKLIIQYGKMSDGGMLCNKSDGGKITKNYSMDVDCPIRQIDNGKVIMIWKNPMEIEKRFGYLRTNIIKCCRKKQITAYGYEWEYENNRSFDNIRPTSARKFNSNRLKGVVCINKFTNERSLFKKISDCADAIGIHRSTVQSILSEKKTNKIWNISYGNYHEY